MPQGSIDYTFNGLATKKEFAVGDIMDKLVELRDESIGRLKNATARFEEKLAMSEGSDTNVTSIHRNKSSDIHNGLNSISYSTEALRLCQTAVDALSRLSSDVDTLELDFTADLSEEVIRAVYKHAKEQGTELSVNFLYTISPNIAQKLAL